MSSERSTMARIADSLIIIGDAAIGNAIVIITSRDYTVEFRPSPSAGCYVQLRDNITGEDCADAHSRTGYADALAQVIRKRFGVK